jgi:hypothetical protein
MLALRCLLFLALAGIALGADPALAPYNLSGEVHDPAGGAVPEASISLLLPGGKLVAQTLTGPGGAFRFSAIRPGAYRSARGRRRVPGSYRRRQDHARPVPAPPHSPRNP